MLHALERWMAEWNYLLHEWNDLGLKQAAEVFSFTVTHHLIAYLLLRFQTFITEHHSNCAGQGFRIQTDDVCAAGANII